MTSNHSSLFKNVWRETWTLSVLVMGLKTIRIVNTRPCCYSFGFYPIQSLYCCQFVLHCYGPSSQVINTFLTRPTSRKFFLFEFEADFYFQPYSQYLKGHVKTLAVCRLLYSLIVGSSHRDSWYLTYLDAYWLPVCHVPLDWSTIGSPHPAWGYFEKCPNYQV